MGEQKEQAYKYESRIDRQTKDANTASFIYTALYKNDIPISRDDYDLLLEHGYITEKELPKEFKKKGKVVDDNIHRPNARLHTDDVTQANGKYIHSGREIKTKEWMPESVVEHSDEFHEFISTMLFNGFQRKANYKPLELYIQQAHNWLSEKDSIENYYTLEEKKAYANQEIKRCKDNSLYFLDKYLMIKDSSILDSDMTSYIAHPVHEVLAFLFDCGYSMFIGKPRQIAATTTFVGLFLKRMAFYKNTFVKFVTMDVDTAEEILEDKMKYPVSQIPEWLRPSVSSDAANQIRFLRKVKGKKGARSGADSKMRIVAPSVAAINGGAPQIVGIDEAAYIKILGKMIREGRPTMFRQDPSTGKLRMIRQVLIWSTGATEEGDKHVKSKSFETEMRLAIEKWQKKEYDYGIIPVFLDWTTRPGITQEFYDQEKKNYIPDDKNHPEYNEKVVQFKLTYPTKVDDMFLSQAKTLVPLTWIEKMENKIADIPIEQKPQYGYFEPILDYSQPHNEFDDLPGKLVGANFVPCEPDSPMASCQMFLQPERFWKYRYYQGTDPIASDTGVSLMASAIYDAYYNAPVCVMNYRHPDHKVNFLQCLLMGLYYDPDNRQGVPHLIESNIGTNLKDYIDAKGFSRSIVFNKQLKPSLHGGVKRAFGLDNRGVRTDIIVNDFQEYLYAHGEKIMFEDVFHQLRYFTCTVSDSGNEKWGTPDKKRHPDDLLFALVFSYLCRMSFLKHEPENMKAEEKQFVERYETYRDHKGNLRRRLVKKRVYGR